MSQVKQVAQKATLAEQGTPLGTQRKKKLYDLWKQGEASQEDYRTVCHVPISQDENLGSRSGLR